MDFLIFLKRILAGVARSAILNILGACGWPWWPKWSAWLERIDLLLDEAGR